MRGERDGSQIFLLKHEWFLLVRDTYVQRDSKRRLRFIVIVAPS